MNDFIQLNPPSDVYEAETMVEGNLHPPTVNWDFMSGSAALNIILPKKKGKILCMNSLPDIYYFHVKRDIGWFFL